MGWGGGAAGDIARRTHPAALVRPPLVACGAWNKDEDRGGVLL